DPSVSGRHAEFEVVGDGVVLRDLGSTNGSSVEGERVEEAQLGHGDEFALGRVQFVLLDRALAASEDEGDGPVLELADDPAAFGESGLEATRVAPRDDALEISAADLARSRTTSKVGPLALLGLAAAAAGVFFWTKGRSSDDGEGGGRVAAAPAAPAGDLLGASYSFERMRDGDWVDLDGGTATFSRSSGAATTGRRGMRAELAPGDVALLASLPVEARGPLKLTGRVRVEGRARAEVGLEFTFDGDRTSTVWAPAPTGADFAEASFDATVPPSATSVRAVVRAASLDPAPDGSPDGAPGDDGDETDSGPEPTGTVDVDDVALVPGDASSGALHQEGTWSFWPLGADASGSLVALGIEWRGDPYAPALMLRRADGTPAAFGARSDGPDLLLTPEADGRLELSTLADLAAPRIATLGDAARGDHPGYLGHGAQFESEGATSLLVGDDASLLQLVFADGRRVTGREAGGVARFQVDVRRGETVRIATQFNEERRLAERLARRARQESRDGEPGVAYATWTELLRGAAFTRELVEEAQAGQSRIAAEGRAACNALEDEVERARFFGLGDLYREKLERARALGALYAGCDAADLAAEIAARIEGELETLDAGSGQNERARLDAIGTALEAEGSTRLAGAVKGYAAGLDEQEGSGDGAKDAERSSAREDG
ncbi:MAG: FHA domain-containing protein, partial [Planctomycetota bacterium]